MSLSDKWRLNPKAKSKALNGRYSGPVFSYIEDIKQKLPVNKCREVAKETGPHLSAYAAIEILSGITYDEVKQFYRGSGLVPQD